MVFAGVAFEVFIAADNPPYGSQLERWGSTVANAFVALGVLGEIVAASRGRVIQGEFTRRSNAELSDVRLLAMVADGEASSASAEAARALSELADAKRGLAEANERAANTELKAAEANERASMAEQSAAEARERAVKLEQTVSGRSLSPEAFSMLVEMFKSFKPKPQAPVVEFEAGNRETYSFAGEIRHALWLAGLQSVRMAERDTSGYTLYGVWVSDAPPGRGWTLMAGFGQAGVGATLIQAEHIRKWGGLITTSDLYIWVGMKMPEMSKDHADRLFAQAREATPERTP